MQGEIDARSVSCKMIFTSHLSDSSLLDTYCPQRSCGEAMFSLVSVCSWRGSLQVTIIHDAFGLTVQPPWPRLQHPRHQTWDSHPAPLDIRPGPLTHLYTK